MGQKHETPVGEKRAQHGRKEEGLSGPAPDSYTCVFGFLSWPHENSLLIASLLA
jgi:hypothetical protein